METQLRFAKRAAVHASQLMRIPSPMIGVERRTLDRIGDEAARATSIVRNLFSVASDRDRSNGAAS